MRITRNRKTAGIMEKSQRRGKNILFPSLKNDESLNLYGTSQAAFFNTPNLPPRTYSIRTDITVRYTLNSANIINANLMYFEMKLTGSSNNSSSLSCILAMSSPSIAAAAATETAIIKTSPAKLITATTASISITCQFLLVRLNPCFMLSIIIFYQ